ncbi:MAG: hypothetical protein AAB740_05565 [Patescibacteria group bacterium]
MIRKLRGLYTALNRLFDGIGDICLDCEFPRCQGYIWLLPQEAKRLYSQGVEVLEVNDDISFINPFSGSEKIDIEKIKPACPWCKSKRCRMYKMRPLHCRMYPLSFATENEIVYLVLHLDCLYAKMKIKDAIFIERIKALFRRVDQKLFKKILETYRSVDRITKFPEGDNRIKRLVALEEFFRKGGEPCPSARPSSTVRR